MDHHRCLRIGTPEAIFCEGKTPEQVVAIVERMKVHGSNILATRCSTEVVSAVMDAFPEATHHAAARLITLTQNPPEVLGGYVAVVCAGTSDIPVAEEAAVTCEQMGNRVERVFDVGVAGIHRLLDRKDLLFSARVIVVVGGDVTEACRELGICQSRYHAFPELVRARQFS